MAVRYEDYGTYIKANGLVVGAGEDAITAGLNTWLNDTRSQIITQKLDSEFAQKGFKTFRFLMKTGVLGETVSGIIQAVEIRVNSNGALSIGFNGSFADLSFNVATDTIGEAIVEAALARAATLVLGAEAVAAAAAYPIWVTAGIVIGGAIVVGLIWTGVKWVYGTAHDIVNGTQDVNLQLFNSSGMHIASLIYEQGSDYDNPDAAVRALIANISHIPNPGAHIEISGGSDSGLSFDLGTDLYNNIATHLGVSFSSLMSL